MARSWSELFGEANAQPEPEAERGGMFARLRDSLAKSRRALTQEIAAAAFDPGDEAAWERLEEALIAGDVGVRATAELIRRLEGRGDLSDLGSALAEEIAALLGEPGRLDVSGNPSVLLVVGVNGTGKTTTIGKLAHRLAEHGHSVVLGAADTFRAAAEEQLEIWADRAGAAFVGSERGGDPAAVAYDAIEAARRDGRDVVIVDTAGRLHTQTNLMEELAKVRRVIAGRLEGAAGTATMTVYQLATRKVRGEPLGTPVPERWEDAPAPAQVAKRLAELTGQRITKEQVPWVTQAMHWAYGISWGPAYALV